MSSISDEFEWSEDKVRLIGLSDSQNTNLCENLSKLHNRKILPCKLNAKLNLQSNDSGLVIYIEDSIYFFILLKSIKFKSNKIKVVRRCLFLSVKKITKMRLIMHLVIMSEY